MTTEADALLDHLSHIAMELSPDAVDQLARQLSRLPGQSASERLTAPTSRERALVKRLVQLWNEAPRLDPVAVALALRAAERVAARAAAQEAIDLIWTGPKPAHVAVRRNDQALREVIDAADEDLLLVSYAVFNVPAVAEGLVRAVDRGARVRLVLEFEGSVEGENTYDPAAALGQLPTGVGVFHWPFAKRPPIGPGGKRGYIHVKCALADRRLAFISSANLTAYAMEANMELGVLVRGGLVPARIADVFDGLMSDRTLVPRRTAQAGNG
jgi:cardiolipin synthase